MDRNRFLRVGLLAATLVAAPALPARAPAQQAGVSEYEGAAGLGLALRRLGTTKRVLMVGAHPDDEYTPLLAHLALGEGADAAYLSLTRGEGGQNGIGTELGEALGILRTEELLAARRADGAEQFFSRAYDFGFSKNADEAFRHWPREELLRDAVAVIRRYRPDVVVTVFSGTPADGHGQHQVSALVGREAFEAAGDPRRFPEQLAQGLRPHRPAKLYQSLWRGTENATLRLQVGGYDPLLGRSPYQLAMASRSRHRSQDMGRPEPAGPQWAYLRRFPAAGPAGDAAAPEASLFAGIDSTLSAGALADAGRRGRVAAALAEYQGLAERLRREANPLEPGRVVPELARALALLDRAEAALAGDASPAVEELRFRLAAERGDARAALARAAGVVFEAVADDARIVPGETLTVALSLWNGGARPARVAALEPALPAGWTAEPLDSLASTVAPGALATRRFRVRVPADAAPSGAYFLRRPRAGDLYAWTGDRAVDGLPFEPAPVRARAELAVEGAALPLEAEATFRDVDPRQGELRRPVLVVPAVSVLLEPPATVLPVPEAVSSASPAPLRYRVRLRAEAPGGVAGTLRLVLPSGWSAEPAAAPLRFAAPGEQREVDFAVRAPVGVAPGDHIVRAVFQAEDGRRFERGVQLVDYPHVRARPLLHDAASRVRAADVRVPRGLRVAYVAGAGEEGPGVLGQLGIVPDLLDAEALATRDLSRYDVVVAGSRAYEVRPDLAAHNARLLEYVRRGGTLIVQYNKYELVEGGFTPYPITMGRPHDRVTDEAAPVRMLEPAHPVFTWPNRITERDFQGWIQERGLYFARTWDPRYTPLLETGDPGEAPLRGGLLVAPYGEGTYVYTGLAFFRQLPEGVPGAWRLFANLLALGADRPAR
ncbi:MAG TPA: PIG-L family deacetylase [Longimicrobiaceae bacterium]|jgi:LmbE family N-acetylglucosaminyl deacetylase